MVISGIKESSVVAAPSERMLPFTRTILYLVTEDWYFCSHRIELARAAKRSGFRVVVATHVNKDADKIQAEGFILIPVRLRRRGASIFGEWRAFLQIVDIYRSVRPDIVHHVALKPILYGTLAARITKVSAVVNTLTGLGYIFISNDWKTRLLRFFVERAYRALLSRSRLTTILQNPDDLQLLVDRHVLDGARAKLISGSGVDLNEFAPTIEPRGVPLVVLPSRLLWDKGVQEFVDAARYLSDAGVKARFALVGDTDPDNPTAIPPAVLARWHALGFIEWFGRRDDMQSVFAQASIVCLPSYREGLPKVLLEAAASARPIVTTDVPGCREVVRQGKNGFLVKVKDAKALAAALRILIADSDLRRRMGLHGREIVESEFSMERVVAETISVYHDLL